MSKATFVAVGKLSRDPKMQYTPQGTALTFLSFPIHSGFGDKQKTIWVGAAVFGKSAEACNQYLAKGKRVFVTGEISDIRVYDKNDGTTGVELQVRATDVTFLDGASVVEDDQHEPEEF
jgi:single-strand DNA-binding protein